MTSADVDDLNKTFGCDHACFSGSHLSRLRRLDCRQPRSRRAIYAWRELCIRDATRNRNSRCSRVPLKRHRCRHRNWHWSSQNPNVAYYEPMVKLLTHAVAVGAAGAVTATPQPPQSESARSFAAAGDRKAHSRNRALLRARSCVIFPQQTRPSKRTRNARTRDDATASTEQVDPREPMQSRPRAAFAGAATQRRRTADRSKERRHRIASIRTPLRQPGRLRSRGHAFALGSPAR